MGSVTEWNRRVRQLHDDVYQELSGYLFSDSDWAGGKGFACRATSEVEIASRARIQRFLKSCPLYDNSKNRWRCLPRVEDDTDTLSLHQPLYDIIVAILLEFGDLTTRTAISTWLEPVESPERGQDRTTASIASDKSFPGIAIMGLGDSFPPNDPQGEFMDRKRPRLFYDDCVTPFLVKTSRKRKYADDIVQMGVYAKKCLEQQHNRHFVYTLHLTEDSFILCMFDRNGVHHSALYDINGHADAFVNVILGVSSVDDELVGFDRNIFWGAYAGHRCLKTVDAEGQPVCYRLESPTPIFVKNAIEGPGTCCWSVRDADGKRLIVKDSWHPSDNWSEGYFLQKAKGLTGVGQMVAYEAGPRISSLRNISPDAAPKNTRNTFVDRTFFRVTFEDAGRPIYQYRTQQEVLYAMRDAIAGHQRLWDVGILHRDISSRNILIGPPGSSIGNRGAVIDLDMSTELLENKRLRKHYWRLGTHFYNSVNVLRSSEYPEENTCHDYADDMESFFYVLTSLVLDRPKVEPYETFLETAESDQSSRAHLVKDAVMFGNQMCPELDNVAPFFGPIFSDLLHNFRNFLYVLHWSKVGGFAPYSYDAIPTYGELKPHAAVHYGTLLRIFDDAIEAYEFDMKEKAKAAVAAAAAIRRTLKRSAAAGDLDECPPQKAQKLAKVPKEYVPADAERLHERASSRILAPKNTTDDCEPSGPSGEKCASRRVPKLEHAIEDSMAPGARTSLKECRRAQRVHKRCKHVPTP